MTPSVNRATTRHSGPAPDARARADGDPLTEKRHDHGVPTVEEAAAVVLEQPRPGWRNAKHARDWPRTVCAPMRSRASESAGAPADRCRANVYRCERHFPAHTLMRDHSGGVGCLARTVRISQIRDTGDPRPLTQGHRFDCDRDVAEQAGPPSEERCHNVATTGVDSGGLQETGGDDGMAET